jgi:hypothetical protein
MAFSNELLDHLLAGCERPAGMRPYARSGLLAVAAAVLLGCSDGLGPRVPAAIAVTPAAPEVLIDGTLQLEAAVVDASGREIGGHAIAFESSDTTVLTVNAGGLLTSAGYFGASLIIMTSGDLTATVEAGVVLPPSTLFVRPGSLELDTEEQGSLSFTVTQENDKPLPAAEVSFQSSDPAILRLELAEWDNHLLFITPLSEGSATVTLTSGAMTAARPGSRRRRSPASASGSSSPSSSCSASWRCSSSRCVTRSS